MILGHKIALDPNDRQATYFAKACGCARLAYNWGLAEWKRQYKAGEKPNAMALGRQFNAIKAEEFPFVLDVTKCAVQLAIVNLGNAFTHFFRSVREGGSVGYPKFKKKGIHDRFSISNDQFRVNGRSIRIPKLGWVRMRETLRFNGKIIAATISKTADRWFVSITVDIPYEPPIRTDETAVGIDWGVSNFATLSTGEKIEGPKPYKALLGRLRQVSRSWSRKAMGSKNRAKAKTKLARLHAHIANVRNDFMHKFTTGIVGRFAVVGIEDLNVAGMVRNHCIARGILDQAPFTMRRMFVYKAIAHGNKLVIADRWEPSSKRCSNCGMICKSLPLVTRFWTCDNCGSKHDRDDNASQNLKNIAVGFTVNACGDGSSGERYVAVRETAASEAGTKRRLDFLCGIDG